VPLYSVLQHGSTFLGGALWLYWYFKWERQAQPGVVPDRLVLSPSARWLICVGLGVASMGVALVSGLNSLPALQTWLQFRLFVGHVFIVGISVFGVVLLGYSAYWQLKARSRKTT
jgi:hypothetical protein